MQSARSAPGITAHASEACAVMAIAVRARDFRERARTKSDVPRRRRQRGKKRRLRRWQIFAEQSMLPSRPDGAARRHTCRNARHHPFAHSRRHASRHVSRRRCCYRRATRCAVWRRLAHHNVTQQMSSFFSFPLIAVISSTCHISQKNEDEEMFCLALFHAGFHFRYHFLFASDC